MLIEEKINICFGPTISYANNSFMAIHYYVCVSVCPGIELNRIAKIGLMLTRIDDYCKDRFIHSLYQSTSATIMLLILLLMLLMSSPYVMCIDSSICITAKCSNCGIHLWQEMCKEYCQSCRDRVRTSCNNR